MKLNIQSLHFTSGEPLNTFITGKVSKLELHYSRIDSAEVCLKIDRSDKRDNKVCEIRLAIPGNDLFAKRRSETFEKAVSETVEALERQIIKLKD